MKTIGIIGGMAWPSTAAYYQHINQMIAQKLGPSHCASLVLMQTDFDQIKTWEAEEQWDKIGATLVSLADQLEKAGADFILIACNTAHKVLPAVKDEISLPVLHIVDVTAQKVRLHGFKTVGLLGTIHTMTDEYFRGHLTDKYSIKAVTPSPEQQETMQHVLEQELVRGVFSESSRVKFRAVIHDLVGQGCEAIILGCTEFGRYLHADDSPVLMIDTLVEHVEAAVERALA